LAFDRLRSRAKEDIQRLHHREAVLKDQLGKLKHDADQLLKSKDQQILALTKELKDLQFELERRGEKIVMSQERITFWKERAARATKALRSAVTVLEGEEGSIL
ncbi:MAG TPA: hypothetical protein VJL87_00165, partial [Bdellovibrionota bacterium]|nr:hypothetical protein [Bdellovibrionota bacterium]